MNSLRPIRIAVCCAVTALAAACTRDIGFNTYSLDIVAVGYDLAPLFGTRPIGYQVGDTVTLRGLMRVDEFFTDPYTVTSDSPYTTFTWVSTDTSLFKVIAPGRVVLLRVGKAALQLSTPDKSGEFMINILPRVTSIVITPDTGSIVPGEGVAFVVRALDASGAPIEAYNRTSGTTAVNVLQNNLSPVVTTPAPSGFDEYMIHGAKAGTARIVAVLPIFGAHKLADTAVIIVR